MLLQVARRSAAQTLHLDFNMIFLCSEPSQNQPFLSEITQVSKLVARLVPNSIQKSQAFCEPD